MQEKETSLENMPTKKYPTLVKTVDELIQRMRDEAHTVSLERNVPLEISPAELISYFLFHALKFKLSAQSQHLDLCCQSILDHISDLINSVVIDRKQAIEHAKKRLLCSKNHKFMQNHIAVHKTLTIQGRWMQKSLHHPLHLQRTRWPHQMLMWM